MSSVLKRMGQYRREELPELVEIPTLVSKFRQTALALGRSGEEELNHGKWYATSFDALGCVSEPDAGEDEGQQKEIGKAIWNLSRLECDVLAALNTNEQDGYPESRTGVIARVLDEVRPHFH